MEIHPSINLDKLLDATAEEDEDIGFCICCGEAVIGILDNARRCQCPKCHQFTVYGAEELIFMLNI